MGGTSTQYVQIGGQILAQEGNEWAYAAPDALGSVRQLADAAGQISLAQSYDPFGNLLEAAGTGASGFGYTGEQPALSAVEGWDANAELLFLRARYYQPDTGRFISRDRFPGDYNRPQSLNGWSYVEGNPINWVDPTGHQASCVPASPTDESWKFCQDDRDLTNWLYRELKNAVAGPEVKTLRTLYHSPSFPLALEGWRSLVANEHRWDFKHRIKMEFGSEIILFRESDHTPYNVEYSVPGNIFYGYVGSAIGIEGIWLHGGGGFAEVTDPAHSQDPNRMVIHICDQEFNLYFNPEWSGTLYDDPYDYIAVEFGIHLWNRYKESMTESQFVQELEQSHHRFAPPPIEHGGNAYGWRNPGRTWPYRVGYFNGREPSWLFPDLSGSFD